MRVDGQEAFRRALEEAYADEAEAVEFYGRLARMAPDPWLAVHFEAAGRDEARHAWMWANMLQLFGWWPPRRYA